MDSFNVLIVGSTGHGKSTFCNYFMCDNLEDYKNIFETSNLKETCTKTIQHATLNKTMKKEFFNKKTNTKEITQKEIKITIYDTPGLNEIFDIKNLNNSNELKNIKEVYEHLYKIKKINLVIFCIRWDDRNDNQLFETIKFYTTLFKEIIYQEKFAILCTKMFNEQYLELKEMNKLDDIKENILDNIKKIVHFEGEPFIDFIDSYIPKHKRNKISTMLKSNMFKDNIHFKSYITKENLITLISTSKPIETTKIKLILPPQINKLKNDLLQLYIEKEKELINTIGITSKLIEKYLNDVSKKSNQCLSIEKEITLTKERIQELSKIYEYCKLNDFGNDWFNIRKKEKFKKQIISPIDDSNLIIQTTHNCEINYKKENKTFEIEISPDLFTLQRNELGHRWYYCLYLSVDGKIWHKKDIKTLNNFLDKLTNEKGYCQTDLNNLVNEKEIQEKEFNEYKKIQNTYRGKIKILNKEYLTYDKFKTLILLIEESTYEFFINSKKDKEEEID